METLETVTINDNLDSYVNLDRIKNASKAVSMNEAGIDNLAVEIPVFLSVFNKNSNVKQNNSSSLLSVNCFIFSFFLVECFNNSNF